MKKISAAGVIMLIGALVHLGCSGGGTTPAPTTGTLTVTGAPSAANAFGASLLKSAQTATLMGTPTSVKLKPIKIFLAQNADCTGPVLVQDKTASAVYEDVAVRPTLFSSSTVTPGTYNCMIIKTTDIFKFTPDSAAQTASSNVCMAGTEYSFDVLKTENTVENWYDLDLDATIVGQGTPGTPFEQVVFMFITTDSAAAMTANNLIHQHQIAQLGSPLVIAAGAETRSAMVVDTANSISVLQDTTTTPVSEYCWLEQLSVSFITQ